MKPAFVQIICHCLDNNKPASYCALKWLPCYATRFPDLLMFGLYSSALQARCVWWLQWPVVLLRQANERQCTGREPLHCGIRTCDVRVRVKAALCKNWYFSLLGSPTAAECISLLHHCRKYRSCCELHSWTSCTHAFVGKLKKTESNSPSCAHRHIDATNYIFYFLS